ncbi:MAG: DUF6036 family nucleotidyltransferase [Archaeoglobaceae archaeon]
MNKIAIQIIKNLMLKPQNLTQLAQNLNKNIGWVSEVVNTLEKRKLVQKGKEIKLADTYEVHLILDLMENYNLEKVLAGKREDILRSLQTPKAPADLEKEGYSTSTIYQALRDFKELGVIEKIEDKYVISDETLRKFFDVEEFSSKFAFTAGDEKLIKTRGEIKETEGTSTAFSAFQRYEVNYFPVHAYIYQGEKELQMEDVLIHAVLFAENIKQMSMCGVFYLLHRDKLDQRKLWSLARKWSCVEKWADLLAYVDQREVRQKDLFPSMEEFSSLVETYGVYIHGRHPKQSLFKGLYEVGGVLTENLDVYLLGGANLILRGLKDSTKDIDVVLKNSKDLEKLVEAFRNCGYQQKHEIEQIYQRLAPSIILEKDGFPRWDIFVKKLAALYLTEKMMERSDRTERFYNLRVHLLSPADIFLFKSITDREGDLEDASLVARHAEIEWKELFNEIKKQEQITGQYLSFAVLDTLELLAERYNIHTPIHNQMVSHCLEIGLILSLDKPKTVKALREELKFPQHQIYNKLRKMEREGKIKVERSGRLNHYKRVEDHN